MRELGDIVLNGFRNVLLAGAILTAGCAKFSFDFAPYRSEASTHNKPVIHYFFAPSEEPEKMYLNIMELWKNVFGNNVEIRPYCAPVSNNGVADELYCENYPDIVLERKVKEFGDDKLPAVYVEGVRMRSNEKLCEQLNFPKNCLDNGTEQMLDTLLKKNERSILASFNSYSLPYQ